MRKKLLSLLLAALMILGLLPAAALAAEGDAAPAAPAAENIAVQAVDETSSTAPIVKNQPEGPGVLWTSHRIHSNVQWKPDLTKVFESPAGLALTYTYSKDGDATFQDWYTTVGFHASGMTEGSYNVVVRATDTNGEYAEFSVVIEVKENHFPTKKANTPDEITVFVPLGLTYTVDANLYYEDVDSKDQGTLKFASANYGAAGSYTATTAGDTVTETAYCSAGGNRCSETMEIKYVAIASNKTDTATAGAAYTIDPDALALDGVIIPGNYKVRVSKGTTGGVEQSFEGAFSFVPKTPGAYTVHIYGDKSAATADNFQTAPLIAPDSG